MREILFRGKRADNSEWETGSLIIVRGGCYDERAYIADKMTGYKTPVIPGTVGQYTGLTDKNGRKIFEGDILEFIGEDNEITNYVVEWQDYKWIIFDEKRYTDDFDEFIKKNMAVIGNIHDSPELLECELI